MESGLGTMAVRSVVRRLEAASRAVFPHSCVRCGEEGESVCGTCASAMEAPGKGLFMCPGCGKEVSSWARCGAAACVASPLDGVLSAMPYGDPAFRKLMRLWKYDRVAEAERAVRKLFAGFAAAQRPALEVILVGATVVPIPLHFLRRASRGFNQSEVLARELVRTYGRPIESHLLKRTFGGTSQASVDDKAKRAANVSGMFRATRRLALGTPIVLVDDVATTGSTLRDCARALKAAGAARVCGVTLLRG